MDRGGKIIVDEWVQPLRRPVTGGAKGSGVGAFGTLRQTQQKGRHVRLAVAALPLICTLALLHGARAAEEGERAKDAAEAVQEGNVSNWLKYYQREREQSAAPSAPPAQGAAQPAGKPPPQPAERR